MQATQVWLMMVQVVTDMAITAAAQLAVRN
jgi:hypothetical protein